MSENKIGEVVDGFGDEWSRFDQTSLSVVELDSMFENYFAIFPWEKLPDNAVGFDLGCGSGRWAKLVAPRVGKIVLIDPSDQALNVAKRTLQGQTNCEFHVASVDEIPLADNSCDFGYSLGVLHHIPDTEDGLQKCVAKVKKGSPFLVYLYYRFDNKPFWFRWIWQISEIIRNFVCRLPHGLRYLFSQILAFLLYLPLARTALLLEKLGMKTDSFPLSQYRHSSFYVMRNDSLDRFGTRFERRFTKAEVKELMEKCGLENISFSTTSFWTAVGYKK
jgi:ubiquinone/menaquinone biosynthesis C-methylase UbiE